MVQIFAARDATGTLKFIADVPRGVACGCACLSCGSPLVAKKGEINEWHFAHEQSQERPECRVGALNLLRRIALEELAASGAWPAAPFEALAGGSASPVRWTEMPAGPLAIEQTPDGTPLGSVMLTRGGNAAVQVCIGSQKATLRPGGGAQAELRIPEPAAGLIRSEDDARRFVRESMVLRWLHLPDTQGLIAAAEQAARDKLTRLRQMFEARQAQAAGERWAIRRSEMQREAPSVSPPARPAPAERSLKPVEWAPGLAHGRSIQYRQLRDGSQWVCYYTGTGGDMRLAQVPRPLDGWDECWPLSVAVPDSDRTLKVVDVGKLLDMLNAHVLGGGTYIDSDPAAIERRFVIAETGPGTDLPPSV